MDAREAVGRRYGEHLTDRDLLALADGEPDRVAPLRRRPELVLDLLDRPAVADAVLTARRDENGRFRHVSPFLVFAAAVHRTSRALVGRLHTPDRTAPRTRVPIFDAPVLAAFADDPEHRLHLAELLASYSRLTSGVVWRRDEWGRRRERWDELDLPALARLLGAVPADQQPGVWRRIGDGALFLAGVFPEHAERTLGGPRLARLTGAGEGPVTELLEQLAGRAYAHVGGAVPAGVAESPQMARRFLALVAERHLFPSGGLLAAGR
ncbi:hypothetical protein EV188_101350 [Actinomycetospora succinea]|uniref:Uncharacterized protein n=1 Tax=Actinomycetospora succinea TaxID=663603 RepID=A0A4R6VP63_9PSEU|nr:hypothetical protein [Actinomycetospora succinea]TDQ65101.1 hypothetical protein EV188_101350 [Actinomycetospora succinea]